MPTRNEILCFVLLAGIQLHIANVFSSGAATPGPTVTYTDKASVEADGWTVSFTHPNSNNQGSYVSRPKSCGATGNYYAFSGSAAVGHMTKVLSGSGTGVLTVGNCWSDGTVRVYKNDVAIGSADVVPASSSAERAASFFKTGCPNRNPVTLNNWRTISDPAAFNDMYVYCDLNANGGANTAQSDACCGTGLTCTPTCIRQTTGTQVPVEFTYVDGDELTIKDEGAASIILLTSLMLTPTPGTCVEDTFKASLQDGEGYYIDPAYNGGEGLCRSVPAANVQAVRDAHANSQWQDADHATAHTYLPRGIFRNLPTAPCSLCVS